MNAHGIQHTRIIKITTKDLTKHPDTNGSPNATTDQNDWNRRHKIEFESKHT